LKLAAKDDAPGGHFFGLPDVTMTVEEEKPYQRLSRSG
jgi:hypothetical protein